jgi:ABC-type branched-subunit amino acid transport system substrate-binding protein
MDRTARGFLALLTALALVGAACNDDGGGGETESELSGKPIKLMTIYEKSEGPAPNPELNEGAVAAADALNRGGGYNDRPYEIIECDTGHRANRAAQCGRQARQEGVVALVGNLTQFGDEFLPLMARKQIPSVGIVGATITDFQSPAAYPVDGGLPATAGSLPTILFQEGCQAVGLVRLDVTDAAAISVFANNALARQSLMLANDVPVPAGASNMRTYVDMATNGGSIDCVVVALSGEDALDFVVAAKRADPDVQLAMILTEAGPVVEALGDDADGVYQALGFVSQEVDTSPNLRFAADMTESGFCASEECTANELGGFRKNSYVSVLVVDQLLDRAGRVSASALWDELNQTTDLTTGYTPPLQWTTPASTGVEAIDRVFSLCLYPVVIRGGAAKPLTGSFFDAYTGADCPTPSTRSARGRNNR